MENNHYFSFLGYCKARKMNIAPSQTQLQCVHQLEGVDWEKTLYKSSQSKLMYICESRYIEKRDWYLGSEYSHSTGGYWEETWYSVLRNSWEIEPACPVDQYRSDMEQALAK